MNAYTTFKELKLGERFFYNGRQWLKKSHVTAKLFPNVQHVVSRFGSTAVVRKVQ